MTNNINNINEEYIRKNNEFIIQIAQTEKAIVDFIKEMIPTINLPNISSNLQSKVNEMFDVFKNDGEALNQHLIIVVETTYLVNLIKLYINSLKAFTDKLFAALNSQDKEKVADVLREQQELERKWNNVSDEIKNFDFFEGLERIINSGMQLPGNVSKEFTLKTCLDELKRVHYIQRTDHLEIL